MSIATKTSARRTICEVLREIYDLAEGDAEMTDRLQDAYVMAKKMDAKLRQHNGGYDEDWWEKERKKVEAKENMDVAVLEMWRSSRELTPEYGDELRAFWKLPSDFVY